MDNTELESDRSAIVTARGTGEGLVLRIDGRVEQDGLKDALRDFLSSRRTFLSGNDVALEWVGEKPEQSFVDDLSSSLFKDFDIKVRSSRLREQSRVMPPEDNLASEVEIVQTPDYRISDYRPSSVRAANARGAAEKGEGKEYSLFDGMESLGFVEADVETPGERSNKAADSMIWDEPDARVLYSTLRSGQKLETEHTLIVFGDINSGAEIIAGGDIVVLGTLRGIAHAGAYDETGGGRFIFALSLQPTQLRIGSVITRGAPESTKGSEIARVDGNTIVVEPYQSRNVFHKLSIRKGPRGSPGGR